MLAAIGFGGVICAIYAWLFRFAEANSGFAGLLLTTIYPNLILVPMAMGFLAAFIWRPLELGLAVQFLCALVITLIAAAAANAFMKEGVVCLLIAAPLLLMGVFTGLLLGRVFFKPKDTLRVTFLPLVIVLILAEGKIQWNKTEMVTDSIVIAAKPSEVWKHVLAFPAITLPSDYWLNKVGLPSAAETKCEGDFVGAKRQCIFSNGLVFEERVTELEAERLLTFEVVEQPRDPELLGHLDLHRGKFELQPNEDGSTTLIGRSWYTLHVRPCWYFDWWTRDITRHVHLRVMEHIKRLSEEA